MTEIFSSCPQGSSILRTQKSAELTNGTHGFLGRSWSIGAGLGGVAGWDAGLEGVLQQGQN